MAGSDDDLGVRFQPQDLGEGRKPFVGSIRVGRQSEVKCNHRGLARPQRFDRALAVAGADHLIALVGPFELTLQALIILDDEEDFGRLGVGHALFLIGSWTGSVGCSAAGSRRVKVVPLPGRLSTLIRPPIATISERASNAPMPKPPGLVESNG